MAVMIREYRISGDAVYKNRLRKKYTQEKLSELSGVSRSQIQRIEKGNSGNCKFDTFMKILVVLEIDWRELYMEEKLDNE